MPVLSARGAAAARGFGFIGGLRDIVITQTFTSSTNWTAPLTTTSVTTLVGKGSDGGGYYTAEIPERLSGWFSPFTNYYSYTVQQSAKPYNYSNSYVTNGQPTGSYLGIHPSTKSGGLCLKDCGGGGNQKYSGAGNNGDWYNPSYSGSRFEAVASFSDDFGVSGDDSRFQTTCPTTFQTLHDQMQGVIDSFNNSAGGTTINTTVPHYFTRSYRAYQAGYWTYYGGSDSNGLGYNFPGGASNSAASTYTYTNIAVTPGSTYGLSIPGGGYLQLTYTYKG